MKQQITGNKANTTLQFNGNWAIHCSIHCALHGSSMHNSQDGRIAVMLRVR
jgi:hypothetical protein